MVLFAKINYYFDLIKHQGLKIIKFNFCVKIYYKLAWFSLQKGTSCEAKDALSVYCKCRECLPILSLVAFLSDDSHDRSSFSCLSHARCHAMSKSSCRLSMFAFSTLILIASPSW